MKTVNKIGIVGAGMMGAEIALSFALQMQDLVGLDNALSVSNILYEEYGERFKPSPILKRKVAANHVGKKSGRGLV